MPEVSEVAFELERFAWTPPDQLEVSGRWSGLEGRRLGRPVLTLTIDGEHEKLNAHPGGHFGRDGKWRALFTYDGEPEAIAGAELEIGRRLVVDLPPPRRRKAPPDGAALAAERKRRQELEETLAERDAEIVGLRDEAETAIGERDSELETLRAEVEKLRAETEEMRVALSAAEAERDRATTELEAARVGAEQRLAAERAAATEIREKLATAREEANATIETEAHETERLRAELQSVREEAEQTVSAERAETARLRDELASRPANGADDDGEPDAAARRMYERVARELEQERAAARSLRRELDAVQAKTAEHRRVASAATANGIDATDDAPAAATPAGRLAASRRTEVGRAATRHRAEAARVAAAQRVPSHTSATATWVVRGIALVLVAGLLIVLLMIVNAVS
jgi:outer membrane murein-binding lipoprotein Lpp